MVQESLEPTCLVAPLVTNANWIGSAASIVAVGDVLVIVAAVDCIPKRASFGIVCKNGHVWLPLVIVSTQLLIESHRQ